MFSNLLHELDFIHKFPSLFFFGVFWQNNEDSWVQEGNSVKISLLGKDKTGRDRLMDLLVSNPLNDFYCYTSTLIHNVSFNATLFFRHRKFIIIKWLLDRWLPLFLETTLVLNKCWTSHCNKRREVWIFKLKLTKKFFDRNNFLLSRPARPFSLVFKVFHTVF